MSHSPAVQHAWETLLAEQRDLSANLESLGSPHRAGLERRVREITATVRALGQLLGLDVDRPYPATPLN